MSEGSTSIFAHVSLGTNDFQRARAFYDALMPSIGCRVLMEFPDAVAYGKKFPEFWVQAPYDGKPATLGNGSHVAFQATSRDEVDAFHKAGLAAGGTDDGAPGPRPDYGAPYYGGFLRDPEGHKIEAMYWDEEMAAELKIAF